MEKMEKVSETKIPDDLRYPDNWTMYLAPNQFGDYVLNYKQIKELLGAWQLREERIAAAEARERELREEIERLKQTKEKIAPVQGYSAGIPWSMHLRAYDAYCKRFGSQKALIDLEGRNCRGGFGVNELDEFIPGWRSELREIVSLRTRAEKAEAQLAEATKPVTDEERDQLNKSTDYAMGDTLERIIPLIDAIIASRAAKGGQ